MFHASLLSNIPSILGAFGIGGDGGGDDKMRRADWAVIAEARDAENRAAIERNRQQVLFNQRSQEAARQRMMGQQVGMFPPAPGEGGFQEFFGFGGGGGNGDPTSQLMARPTRDIASNLTWEQHILKDIISGVSMGWTDQQIRAYAKRGTFTKTEFQQLAMNVPLMMQIWNTMGGVWTQPAGAHRREFIMHKIDQALATMKRRRRRYPSINQLIKMGNAAKVVEKALKKAGYFKTPSSMNRGWTCVCKKKNCTGG